MSRPTIIQLIMEDMDDADYKRMDDYLLSVESRTITRADIPESMVLEIVGEWLLEHKTRMHMIPPSVKQEIQADYLENVVPILFRYDYEGPYGVDEIDEFCDREAAKLREQKDG